MKAINRCPATLKTGFTGYCPAALRKLFDGKKVSHILSFYPPEQDSKVQSLFFENRQKLSISGVQKKVGLVLDRNQLRLSQIDEQSRYILKPAPDDLAIADQVPANEHLTMQLAEQVFKIQTALNALIFFKSGSPAYFSRRFDFKPDGKKYGMEDFASLAQKTRENAGTDFKYEASCEKLFLLLKEFVGAYLIEAQKLYRLVLFNYLFSNGDAHLKNFSLIETQNGDYVLSPAYDLICTRLHVRDSDIAFKEGLFEDDYETESFKVNGFYAKDDFYELGKKTGLPDLLIRKEIQLFLNSSEKVKQLLNQSFLREDLKKIYFQLFEDKLKRLAYSYSKQI